LYSPFYDAKGKPLNIFKVKYDHLEQLKDCDEGHHLEFKQLLEVGGKNQLAKEIASFANCEGGWLIVGIEDKAKEIKPIDKFDYSQKVGKIVSRVSPMPEFETKFICMPDDKAKGVLIIYVYEGRNAPYICDGSIYIRCGSNKEPIKPADRGNVEYLVQRSASYQKELEAFFHRDYFFAYNNLLFQKVTYPIACVYLKNIAQRKDNWFNNYSNRKKFIQFINEQKPQFEYVQYSMNSIVFKQKQTYPGLGGTIIFEIFYDWSCKIYIPLGVSDSEEIDEIKRFYSSIGIPDKTVEQFRIINAGVVCNGLMFCLMAFDDIAKKYHLKEKDYAFCTEVENAGDSIMCFSGEKYKEYVKKHGLPFAVKAVNKSKIIYFRDLEKIKFQTLIGAIVNDFIGPTFGFESDIIWEILDDDNLKYDLEELG
jgi:hypothetical protein